MANTFKAFIFCCITTTVLIGAFSALAEEVSKETIINAVSHPGPKTERRLNDLLRSDYHKYLSEYYLNKKKAGFMALERFELTLSRAIGDIRLLSQIKDKSKRQQLATEAFDNWTAGFKRAQVNNMPK